MIVPRIIWECPRCHRLWSVNPAKPPAICTPCAEETRVMEKHGADIARALMDGDLALAEMIANIPLTEYAKMVIVTDKEDAHEAPAGPRRDAAAAPVAGAFVSRPINRFPKRRRRLR